VADPPGGTTRGWHAGDPVAMGGVVTIRVEADARTSPTMILHGRRALNGTPLAVGNDRPRYGQAPDGYGVETAYPGGIPLVPYEPDVCREAYAQAD
jgi:hypothetical protein